MLKFEKFDDNIKCRTIKHSPNVFHEALNYVKEGETYFHVSNCDDEDYDLIYENNHQISLHNPSFPPMEIFRKNEFYPAYLNYDEHNLKMMFLNIFDLYENVYFKTFDEYSVVLAKLILEHTNKTVYFDDKRIHSFIPENPKLNVGNPISDKKLMTVSDEFNFKGLTHEFQEGMYDKIWIITLFHNVFFPQGFTNLNYEDIKYVQIAINKEEGIGSIIMNFNRMKLAFKEIGFESYLKPGTTKYKDKLIEKCINIQTTIPEMNESNTIYIDNSFTLFFTYATVIHKLNECDDILNPKFTVELEEYADAVIGNQKNVRRTS